MVGTALGIVLVAVVVVVQAGKARLVPVAVRLQGSVSLAVVVLVHKIVLVAVQALEVLVKRLRLFCCSGRVFVLSLLPCSLVKGQSQFDLAQLRQQDLVCEFALPPIPQSYDVQVPAHCRRRYR